MKNKIFTGCFMLIIIILTSCMSEENYVTTSADAMKTYELKNFEEAMKSLGKPENRPTNENMKSTNGIELSQNRQMILLESAKQFLIAEGMTEEQLNAVSTKEIIAQAFETRTKKLNEISSELKSLNYNN